MENSEIEQSAIKLVNYFLSNKHKFSEVTQRIPYYNMGATITDAVLQAGLSYKHVVYPRVYNILTKYGNYKTTCHFIILFKTIPLTDLLNWKNPQKLKRIEDLAWFLQNSDVQTEDQLSHWLMCPGNLEKLLQVNGIGFKTIDYLKMLSGIPAIPIDRHLFKFLKVAGITVKTYSQASQIFNKAANIMNINKNQFDKMIWVYMSNNTQSTKIN